MNRVFIADDEMWIIIGLKKLIEKSGLPFWVIGEANNGVAALEDIEEKRPDVLFTDIRMPGYNGLELMEKGCRQRSYLSVDTRTLSMRSRRLGWGLLIILSSPLSRINSMRY